MNILLHQFNRERQSLGILLYVWLGTLALQWLIGATGLGGSFYGDRVNPLMDRTLGLLDVIKSLGIVLLPAALALADPPNDEEAQWRALPIRAGRLLAAKLLALLLWVALPLALMRYLLLVSADAGEWTGHMLLDVLSHLPAWVLLGFAFGALAGDWKRFAVGMVSLQVVAMLIVAVLQNFVHHGYDMANHPAYVFFLLFESGIEDNFTNNFYLLAAVVAILLRYFTRLRGVWITAAFVAALPLAAVATPFFFSSWVPQFPGLKFEREDPLEAGYDRPSRMLIATNSGSVRLLGQLPYSALHLTGMTAPDHLLPLQLRSKVSATTNNGSSFSFIAADTFRFPGHVSPGNWSARFGLERHLTLDRAVPEMKVVNPMPDSGEGFILFNLHEPILGQFAGARFDLDTELWVVPGAYVKLGELPLRTGAVLDANGTTMRVAAWLPDAGARTQIKLNQRYVRFATERDGPYVKSSMDPRRRPSNLRFILVNKQRREACLPDTQYATSGYGIVPIAFGVTLLSYSVRDVDGRPQSVAADWLAEAELHVFRSLTGVQAVIRTRLEDLKLGQLPIEPLPVHIDAENP